MHVLCGRSFAVLPADVGSDLSGAVDQKCRTHANCCYALLDPASDAWQRRSYTP